MSSCISCGNYTKYNNGYCYKCYKKINNIDKSKITKLEKEMSSKNGFPTHTELYRDLHKIEKDILKEIFRQMDFTFRQEGLFRTKETEFEVRIEEDNWDIKFIILDTPDKDLTLHFGNEVGFCDLYLEYKSSINEWGKQIDQFFRQIIYKKKKSNARYVFLISFDPEFEDYDKACERAGIILIVLPKRILKKIRGVDFNG